MIKATVTALDDGYEDKSIYLRKDGEEGYLGLHSIGEPIGDGSWIQMDSWANAYSAEKKFQASIFRIYEPLEELAASFVADGWVVVEDWKS